MKTDEWCTLCENNADPRFRLGDAGRSYPLCDGCAPDYASEQSVRRVLEFCRAIAPLHDLVENLIKRHRELALSTLKACDLATLPIGVSYLAGFFGALARRCEQSDDTFLARHNGEQDGRELTL